MVEDQGRVVGHRSRDTRRVADQRTAADQRSSAVAVGTGQRERTRTRLGQQAGTAHDSGVSAVGRLVEDDRRVVGDRTLQAGCCSDKSSSRNRRAAGVGIVAGESQRAGGNLGEGTNPAHGARYRGVESPIDGEHLSSHVIGHIAGNGQVASGRIDRGHAGKADVIADGVRVGRIVLDSGRADGEGVARQHDGARSVGEGNAEHACDGRVVGRGAGRTAEDQANAVGRGRVIRPVRTGRPVTGPTRPFER